MNNPHPEFGGRRLSDPGLSKHLDVLTAENRALDEKIIREEREQREDAVTRYLRRFVSGTSYANR